MENNNIEFSKKRKDDLHMKNKSSLIKKGILIILTIYALITIIKQQKIINSYTAQAKQLQLEIAEAEERQEHLNNEKESVNSTEYIEELAREKLGMYMPNERVYVDSEN